MLLLLFLSLLLLLVLLLLLAVLLRVLVLVLVLLVLVLLVLLLVLLLLLPLLLLMPAILEQLGAGGRGGRDGGGGGGGAEGGGDGGAGGGAAAGAGDAAACGERRPLCTPSRSLFSPAATRSLCFTWRSSAAHPVFSSSFRSAQENPDLVEVQPSIAGWEAHSSRLGVSPQTRTRVQLDGAPAPASPAASLSSVDSKKYQSTDDA